MVRLIQRVGQRRGRLETEDDRRSVQSDGRRPKGQCHECGICEYRSNRQFNVLRHQIRIHERKIWKYCCGQHWKTKGAWYAHCEAYHPGMRNASVTSRTKYKILGPRSLRPFKSDPDTSENESEAPSSPVKCRSSLRIRKQLTKKRETLLAKIGVNSTDEVALEDIPLSYFAEDPQLLRALSFSRQDSEVNEETAASDEIDKTFEQKPPELSQLPPERERVEPEEDCENLSNLFDSSWLSSDGEVVDEQTFNLEELQDDQPMGDVVRGILTENNNIYNMPSFDRSDFMAFNCVASALQPLWSLQNSENKENDLPQRKPEDQCLPPKKKILRKYLNRVTSRPAGVLKSQISQENIGAAPLQRVVIRETLEVKIERQVEISWHEISERHRAYLSGIDFDQLKEP